MNTLPSDPSAPKPTPLKLFVRTGLSAGAEFEPTGEFVIGRGSGCLVQLKDDVVSRGHCKVFWEQGRWWVEDLKSANGLFIGEQRITREPIATACIQKNSGLVRPNDGFKIASPRKSTGTFPMPM